MGLFFKLRVPFCVPKLKAWSTTSHSNGAVDYIMSVVQKFSFDFFTESSLSSFKKICAKKQFFKLCSEKWKFKGVSEFCLSFWLESIGQFVSLVEIFERFNEHKPVDVKIHTNQLMYVAAHLRSLRSDDPVSKGHPRPIKQKLELCQYQTYFRNY